MIAASFDPTTDRRVTPRSGRSAPGPGSDEAAPVPLPAVARPDARPVLRAQDRSEPGGDLRTGTGGPARPDAPPDPRRGTEALARVQGGAQPVWDARDLTDGSGQGRIVLGDQVYTLRITRAGKLILTK